MLALIKRGFFLTSLFPSETTCKYFFQKTIFVQFCFPKFGPRIFSYHKLLPSSFWSYLHLNAGNLHNLFTCLNDRLFDLGKFFGFFENSTVGNTGKILDSCNSKHKKHWFTKFTSENTGRLVPDISIMDVDGVF